MEKSSSPSPSLASPSPVRKRRKRRLLCMPKISPKLATPEVTPEVHMHSGHTSSQLQSPPGSECIMLPRSETPSSKISKLQFTAKVGMEFTEYRRHLQMYINKFERSPTTSDTTTTIIAEIAHTLNETVSHLYPDGQETLRFFYYILFMRSFQTNPPMTCWWATSTQIRSNESVGTWW